MLFVTNRLKSQKDLIEVSQHQQTITNTPGAAFDLIALASSAGGLKALSEVLSGMPADFPAPITIVQHLDPKRRSLMATILRGRTKLDVKEAEEADQLLPATVYIAPPDSHLLVNSNRTLSLSQSEMTRFLRPSADVLFQSIADSYKDRAIAVVLTGSGSDGMVGVKAIKKMGGKVIAQNQATAEFFGMPGAAIESGSVDFILPLGEIAPALIALVTRGELK